LVFSLSTGVLPPLWFQHCKTSIGMFHHSVSHDHYKKISATMENDGKWCYYFHCQHMSHRDREWSINIKTIFTDFPIIKNLITYAIFWTRIVLIGPKHTVDYC
jgi:hypothetical protein